MNILKYSLAGIFVLVVVAAFMGLTSRKPMPIRTEADKNIQRAYAGAVELKKTMRDPASFTLGSALVMDTGAVCYEYRARNGFGGMNADQAVLTPAGEMKLGGRDGFSAAWKKLCAGKTGTEAGALLNGML